MRLVVGIDEAGYGPLLGPLVSAASVWEVAADGPPAGEQAWWSLLEDCVAAAPRKAEWRVTVGDSKQVFKRQDGLGVLERAVLAFAQLGGAVPTSTGALLAALGDPARPLASQMPWYRGQSRTLPTVPQQAASAAYCQKLEAALRAAGLRCRGLLAEVVAEDAYNERVSRTRNKAEVLLERVLRLIVRAVGQVPGDCELVIDRLGGRTHYHDVLLSAFPERALEIRVESPARSVYRLRGNAGDWTVTFALGADRDHFPVALASMTAKYVRELLMLDFNAYWQRYCPDVRPTAGYYNDAQRFLQEIAPYAVQDELRLEQFVRLR